MSPSLAHRRESALLPQDRHVPTRSRFALLHSPSRRPCLVSSPHRIFATTPWLDTRECSSVLPARQTVQLARVMHHSNGFSVMAGSPQRDLLRLIPRRPAL